MMSREGTQTHRMLPASYLGYRRCAARAAHFELVVQVDQARLSWCLPGPAEDGELPTPVADYVELQWHHTSALLAERRTDSAPAEPISLARALALLGNGHTQLRVDERLAALHA